MLAMGVVAPGSLVVVFMQDVREWWRDARGRGSKP
jgi:hypothetical protein